MGEFFKADFAIAIFIQGLKQFVGILQLSFLGQPFVEQLDAGPKFLGRQCAIAIDIQKFEDCHEHFRVLCQGFGGMMLGLVNGIRAMQSQRMRLQKVLDGNGSGGPKGRQGGGQPGLQGRPWHAFGRDNRGRHDLRPFVNGHGSFGGLNLAKGLFQLTSVTANQFPDLGQGMFRHFFVSFLCRGKNVGIGIGFRLVGTRGQQVQDGALIGSRFGRIGGGTKDGQDRRGGIALVVATTVLVANAVRHNLMTPDQIHEIVSLQKATGHLLAKHNTQPTRIGRRHRTGRGGRCRRIGPQETRHQLFHFRLWFDGGFHALSKFLGQLTEIVQFKIVIGQPAMDHQRCGCLQGQGKGSKQTTHGGPYLMRHIRRRFLVGGWFRIGRFIGVLESNFVLKAIDRGDHDIFVIPSYQINLFRKGQFENQQGQQDFERLFSAIHKVAIKYDNILFFLVIVVIVVVGFGVEQLVQTRLVQQVRQTAHGSMQITDYGNDLVRAIRQVNQIVLLGQDFGGRLQELQQTVDF